MDMKETVVIADKVAKRADVTRLGTVDTVKAAESYHTTVQERMTRRRKLLAEKEVRTGLMAKR